MLYTGAKKGVPKNGMRTVAVIEDDEILAGSLRQLFEADGARAFAFPDAPPVEELAGMHPDLVILDCILMTTSGPDYLKELRGNPELAEVPVIMTTGCDALYESLKELESEHVAVLRKPLGGAELKETARRLSAA